MDLEKKLDSVDPGEDAIWQTIRRSAEQHLAREPILGNFLRNAVLNHDTLEGALSFCLAKKLAITQVASKLISQQLIEEVISQSATIREAARADIIATYERDSACDCLSTPLLFYKGFHALQASRVAHWLWNNDQNMLALLLQSHISTVFGVDIHPAARIGRGIMLDHATGIVIGETAVIEDNVSIMQSVTLGGTGNESGDRHPKIGRGVLIGPGAHVLGNIQIGAGAHISAGSVVLKPVPPHTVVAGVPAKVIGEAVVQQPALEMHQELRCKSQFVE